MRNNGMITLQLHDGLGNRRKIRSITLPEYNYADQFVRDERGKADSNKWYVRLAFGSFDAAQFYATMESFVTDIPPAWVRDGFDALHIINDEDGLQAIWYHPHMTITRRTFDSKRCYFVEIETPRNYVYNTKDSVTL